MEQLPSEMAKLIGSFVECKDILSLAMVSKTTRGLFTDQQLWKYVFSEHFIKPQDASGVTVTSSSTIKRHADYFFRTDDLLPFCWKRHYLFFIMAPPMQVQVMKKAFNDSSLSAPSGSSWSSSPLPSPQLVCRVKQVFASFYDLYENSRQIKDVNQSYNQCFADIELISSVVSLLHSMGEHSDDKDKDRFIELMVKSLKILSLIGPVKETLSDVSAVGVLMSVLRLRKYTAELCGVFSNIAFLDDSIYMTSFRHHHLIDAVVEILSSFGDDPTTLQPAFLLLRNITNDDNDNRVVAHDKGCVEKTIDLIKKHLEKPTLLQQGTCALGNLACLKENAGQFVRREAAVGTILDVLEKYPNNQLIVLGTVLTLYNTLCYFPSELLAKVRENPRGYQIIKTGVEAFSSNVNIKNRGQYLLDKLN